MWYLMPEDGNRTEKTPAQLAGVRVKSSRERS